MTSQIVSVLPWQPPPLIITPGRVSGPWLKALSSISARTFQETKALIGVSWISRLEWVAMRCRSCRRRCRGVIRAQAPAVRTGAGTKFRRVSRQWFQPAQTVRSGTGPGRNNAGLPVTALPRNGPGPGTRYGVLRRE